MTPGRYIPGTDPLAPQPYTDEQREDLVQRTRLSERLTAQTRARRVIAQRRRKAAEVREQMVLIGKAGAYYAHEARCSFVEAANVACSSMPIAWRTTRDAISKAWSEMYPGERPARRGKP